jgi:hypothetical protein
MIRSHHVKRKSRMPAKRRPAGIVRVLPFAAAALLASHPSQAADAPPVLLVVPPGIEVARVEAARAAVPASRALLTVGASERVPLRDGIELLADRGFPDAPQADLVVVLPGEAKGEEEFLLARRATARAILFLGESPLLARLKGDGSRGALVLVGGPEAIRALAGGPPPAASEPRETARPTATPRPSSPASSSESPARKYFTARTPTPTPAGSERR